MKVKEANIIVDNLKRTANNLRLINQYMLNHPELRTEIEEATGMNSPTINVLNSAHDELSALADRYTDMIENAEIGEL